MRSAIFRVPSDVIARRMSKPEPSPVPSPRRSPQRDTGDRRLQVGGGGLIAIMLVLGALQWVEHDRTAPYEVPLATSRSS
jgi:hypothetical protein